MKMISATSAPFQESSTLAGNERIPLLDGYRFLAAMAVCCFHYWSNVTLHLRNSLEYGRIFDFPTLDFVFRYGYLGVPLFFLISGFVIALSAEGRTFAAFMSSRITRILPTYWLAIAVTTAFLLVEGTAYREVTIRQVFANLFMLQAPLGEQFIDMVYWTIVIEIRFYLLVALLIALNIYRHYAWLLLAWLMLCLLDYSGVSIGIFRQIFITSYGYYFAAGGAFYFLYRRQHMKLSLLIIALSLVIAVPVVAGALTTKYGVEVQVPMGLLLLGCYAMMAIIAMRRSDVIGWSWLPLAGSLTYPFYLLHEDVGFILMRHITITSNGFVLTIVVIGLLLVMSWVVHRYFERIVCSPLRRRIEQGWGKWSLIAQTLLQRVSKS